MRTAIIFQCFSTPSLLYVHNGVLLLYLTAKAVPVERIVLYLALPMLAEGISRLPCAHLADRHGMKRVGMAGCVLETIGFALIVPAGWLDGTAMESCVVVALLLYGVGMGCFTASWFAILSPIVPPPLRGRFFGRLRMAWQMTGILFFSGCALLFDRDAPIGLYQGVMLLTVVGLFVRVVMYRQLPELDEPDHDRGAGLAASLGRVARREGFMSFGCYVFLLSLFTFGAPALFGLVAKHRLGLGDNVVVWLGITQMIGSLLGFHVGGRAVDRFGTRGVFLVCHLSYGVVLFAFLLRPADAVSLLVLMVAMVFLGFGAVRAASSIAISTEILALMPPQNKAIASSIVMTLAQIGGALSGILSAWVLDAGMLSDSWTLWGLTMTPFDAILAGFAIMVVLLVVTLGLVPSVIRKAEWMPQ